MVDPLTQHGSGATYFDSSSYLKFVRVNGMNGDEEIDQRDSELISLFSFSDLVVDSWSKRFKDRK